MEGATESVWDYPRPPRLDQSGRSVRVEFGGTVIAETQRAFRVLETSHPPTIYIPPQDVTAGALRPSRRRPSMCEWKGSARYFDVVGGDGRVAEAAGWSYPSPVGGFDPLRDYLAVYPGMMDACYLDGERVQSQEGDFYGGWITSWITGPFKGAPGTRGW